MHRFGHCFLVNFVHFVNLVQFRTFVHFVNFIDIFTIDIVIITILGRLTLDPAGMHCPSWDDAFVSSLVFIYAHSWTRLSSNRQCQSTAGRSSIGQCSTNICTALPSSVGLSQSLRPQTECRRISRT